MSRFNTGNPIGSADPRDRDDNTKNLDELVNSKTKTNVPDRLGVPRKTWHSMESEFSAEQSARASEFNADQSIRALEFDSDQLAREQQYQQVILGYGNEPLGDYAAGIEVTGYNQIIRDCAGGTCVFYRAAVGTELPYTTTGLGMPEGGAFVDVGDAVLRNDLAAAGGATLVGNGGIVFDSVADMVVAAWLTVGQKVKTLGYYTTGDGGGNDYEIVATATGTADGGSYIDLTGISGQARGLLSSGIVSVGVFGAASSRTPVQNKTALQNAISHFDGAAGVIIIPPSVDYGYTRGQKEGR